MRIEATKSAPGYRGSPGVFVWTATSVVLLLKTISQPFAFRNLCMSTHKSIPSLRTEVAIVERFTEFLLDVVLALLDAFSRFLISFREGVRDRRPCSVRSAHGAAVGAELPPTRTISTFSGTGYGSADVVA